MNKKYLLPFITVLGGLAVLSAGTLLSQTLSPYQYNYRSTCQPCHGKTGAGDGPAARLLPVKVPDWTKNRPDYFTHEDALKQRLEALRNGRIKTKRSFTHFTGGLSEAKLRDVASYIREHRSLNSSRYPTGYNQTYEDACIYCHGLYGDGKGIITGFRKAPLNFRSKELAALSGNDLLARLRASQNKRIVIQKDIAHFPHSFNDAEMDLLKTYLQRLK